MSESRLKTQLRVCVGLILICAPLYAGQTTVTIVGSEQFMLPGTWDAGSFSITLNGRSETISYGQFSTTQSIASGIAAKFSLDCNSPVSARASGAVITFTTKQTNISLGQISSNSTWDAEVFAHASFNITPGSAGNGPVTPSLYLSCTPNPIPAGGTADCTARLPEGTTGTVAFSLDGQPSWSTVNVDSTGWATASALSGLQSGGHTLAASYSGNNAYNPTSQTSSILVDSGALATNAIYSYNINQYAANSNILAYTDSVNGQWSQMQYDSLSRLTGGSLSPAGNLQSQNYCWTYDSFGNRTLEAISTTSISAACANNSSATSYSATYTTNNQIVGLYYDVAGNVTNDGINTYLYDGDGRVCAIATRPFSGGTVMYQYIYDADGNRVAKGTISAFSCDTSTNGFLATNSYVLDQSGNSVTEMAVVNGQPAWAHTNLYAGGMLLGTYDPQGLHFQLSDWLGSRRVQTNAFGQTEEICSNLPFGNTLNCAFPSNAPSTADDATEHHFTGKERDSESGLDYFGARYYGSSMGRFMSPDPIIMSPARIANPQLWNAYSYVGNNPLGSVDPNGEELVQLGQHTDQQIKDQIKIDNAAQKDKDLDPDIKEALRQNKTTLQFEKQGNAVAGAYLNALDSVGQRNGLQLSDITLSTDVAHDFSSMGLSGAQQSRLSDPNTQAFVLNKSGTMYLKSETALFSGTFDQTNGPWLRDFGGTVLRHEQVHTGGGGEFAAYTVQRQVWQYFKNNLSLETFGRMDGQLQKSIEQNKNQ